MFEVTVYTIGNAAKRWRLQHKVDPLCLNASVAGDYSGWAGSGVESAGAVAVSSECCL